MELINGSTTLPAKCFLCERGFEDNELAANTGLVFDPDFPHALYGTKMVCSNCAKVTAQAHGFVTQTVDEYEQQNAAFFADLDAVRAERDALQAQVDEGVSGVLKLVERTQERTRRAASKTAAG